jgi:hypothetical protein
MLCVYLDIQVFINPFIYVFSHLHICVGIDVCMYFFLMFGYVCVSVCVNECVSVYVWV